MIIGLTGSIATGKSTVANRLKEHGLPIVDADLVARQVVQPGNETLQKIHQAFGDKALLPDGSMNREEIGRLIFGDKVKRELLNSIIHPAIREEMIRQRDKYVQQGETIVIMDIPLLFESKLQHFVEYIVVVGVSPEIQKSRLMARNNFTEQQAMERIESQISIEDKIKQAHEVIMNNGTVEELNQEVDRRVAAWKAQLSE